MFTLSIVVVKFHEAEVHGQEPIKFGCHGSIGVVAGSIPDASGVDANRDVILALVVETYRSDSTNEA